MFTAAAPVADLTTTELIARVGNVPLWRIRRDPAPGTATEEDFERIRNQEDRLYELIDGVLVEKAVSDESAFLSIEIVCLLQNFIRPLRVGWILGSDGFVRLFGTRLRAAAVSFVRRDQRPNGRPLKTGYASVAPALAVEVFTADNTVSELQQKRGEFFAAGTNCSGSCTPSGKRSRFRPILTPTALSAAATSSTVGQCFPASP